MSKASKLKKKRDSFNQETSICPLCSGNFAKCDHLYQEVLQDYDSRIYVAELEDKRGLK